MAAKAREFTELHGRSRCLGAVSGRYFSAILFLALSWAPVVDGQDVPPIVDDSSNTPSTQPLPTLPLFQPDPCAAQPCLQPATGNTTAAPPVTNWNPSPSSSAVPPVTAAGTVESIDTASKVYDVGRPIFNTNFNQAFKTNVEVLGESSAYLGPAIGGAQVLVKGYNTYQQTNGDWSAVAAAGGKEATLQVVDQCVTTAVTCLAAETGPAAVPIGMAAGYLAKSATEYAIDHPDIIQQLAPCDDQGVCLSNMDYQGSGAARQGMENQFNTTSAANDQAAQEAAAQQAAEAEAAAAQQDTSQSATGMDVFLAGLNAITQVAAMTAKPAPMILAPTSAPAPMVLAPAPVPSNAGPPAGWVSCSCPAQHASFGQYYNGSLYHPVGPKCNP